MEEVVEEVRETEEEVKEARSVGEKEKSDIESGKGRSKVKDTIHYFCFTNVIT